jgi:hypothetical protein
MRATSQLVQAVGRTRALQTPTTPRQQQKQQQLEQLQPFSSRLLRLPQMQQYPCCNYISAVYDKHSC